MEFSPVLIFLIISIVSSIFNAVKKKQEADARRTSQPKTKSLPKKIEQDLFDWDEVLIVEAEKEFDQPNPVLTPLTTDQNLGVDLLVEESPEESLKTVEKGPERLTKVVERYKEIDFYDKDRPNPTSILPQMTKENVRQGVIMAEILRPPRARRPYRPSYLEDK